MIFQELALAVNCDDPFVQATPPTQPVHQVTPEALLPLLTIEPLFVIVQATYILYHAVDNVYVELIVKLL